MWKTVVRRLIILIPQLFALSLLIFFLAQFMPGDALRGLVGPGMRPEAIQELRELYGMNDPWFTQYLRWMGGIFQGDFGNSITFQRPVIVVIGERIGNTMLLSFTSTVFTYLAAIPLGLIAARFKGKVIDKGITDPGNMGAAMAPAAVDTLLTYFRETGASPADFDIIATGDLGVEGTRIVEQLLLAEGLDLCQKYSDCGLLIYNLGQQDVHAGGSGCGCSAAVTAGFFMEKFKAGEYKNILLVGTGALMSPGSIMQGNSIPGIAHLVRIVM